MQWLMIICDSPEKFFDQEEKNSEQTEGKS